MAILYKNWSAGKLILFKSCPFAFYAQEVLKLPQLPSATVEVSNAVRAALENILRTVLENAREPLAKKDVIKLITNACVEKLTEGLHPKKKTVTDITSMVNNTIAEIDLRNFGDVGIEEWYEIPLDRYGHVVRGKIDLKLVLQSGMPYVINYKTGTEFEPHGDIQLLTYALAQRVAGYKENILGGLFFMRKNTLAPTLITTAQVQEVLSYYKKAAQDVESRLIVGESAFEAIPCYKCEYCSYSGLCPKAIKIGEFPATIDDLTPERAKELAEWLLVAERSVSIIRERIKEYADRQEGSYFEVNGGYFGKKSKSSMEWRLGDVLDTLQRLKIDDTVFRNILLGSTDVKSYMTAKKYSGTSLKDELSRRSQTVTRNHFGYYKGLPEKGADDLSESEEAVA